jgi:RNA polymerase sigma factor (sigma-70 family)
MVQNLSFQYTDNELITECLQNNRSAQREMYERLSSRMFSVCLRYVGDKEVAKDILHDGFITLFAKLGTFRGDGSFEGWARRIFVTTALMHLRKTDILKRTEELDAHGLDLQIDSTVMEKLDARRLMRLIEQMPVGFRTVFNLFVIEEFTHNEIAKELHITEGGSRSQLSRARVWLKEKLKDFE